MSGVLISVNGGHAVLMDAARWEPLGCIVPVPSTPRLLTPRECRQLAVAVDAWHADRRFDRLRQLVGPGIVGRWRVTVEAIA